jgi:hypothetical protein
LRTKLWAPKAITATAHRLARLVYRMLRYGQDYKLDLQLIEIPAVRA